MALWVPGVPRYFRPTAGGRGLPGGVAWCGSRSAAGSACGWACGSWVLTWIRVTGGGLGASEPLLGRGLREAWRSCATHALGTGMLTAFHLAGGASTEQPVVGCGAMAQLVARLHGMQKVRGSNPLSSTGFSRTRSNEKRQTKSQCSGIGAFFVFRAEGAAADSGRLTCLTCPPPALEGSNPLP